MDCTTQLSGRCFCQRWLSCHRVLKRQKVQGTPNIFFCKGIHTTHLRKHYKTIIIIFKFLKDWAGKKNVIFFRTMLKYKTKMSIKSQGNRKYTLHIVNKCILWDSVYHPIRQALGFAEIWIIISRFIIVVTAWWALNFLQSVSLFGHYHAVQEGSNNYFHSFCRSETRWWTFST